MTDYGTIKIPRDEYERHNRRRKMRGQSWAEYVDGEAPDADLPPSAELDADALAEQMADALDPPTGATDDAVREAIRTIETRTGRIEQLLEDITH